MQFVDKNIMKRGRNIRMKNKILRWFSVIITLTLMISVLPIVSKAEENPLPFNKDVVGYLVKNDAIDTYKLNVPSAGHVAIKLTSYVDDQVYIQLYDENNEVVFTNYVNGNQQNPGKYYNGIDLEAGTYYIKVYDNYDSDDNGKYILKATFKAANNTEKEPNGGTENAASFAFNKTVRGFLSWNDSIDTYKIIVPKAGNVAIDLSSYVDDTAYIQLIDDYNNEIFRDYVNGNAVNPGKYYNSVDLEPGTYYIKVYDNYDSDDTGVYTLNAKFLPANNTEKEPNNGIVEAQSISFYQKITGFLSWNDSVDVYKISLPKNSSIGVNVTSYVSDQAYIQLLDNRNNSIFSDYIYGSSKNPGKYVNNIDLKAGTYYLKICDTYGSDDTGKYGLQVTANYLLPPLSINPIKSNATKITGKTEKNAQVTVSIGKKKHQMKANAKGEFSVGINKQKIGTTIHVSAKGTHGTTSKTAKVVK